MRSIKLLIYIMSIVIHYIHYNYVQHNFVEQMFDYPWSSYLTILSVKETKLKRDNAIGWFNSREGYDKILF